MPAKNLDDRKTIAQIAIAARWGTTTDPTLEERHRKLVVNRIAAFVSKVVVNAPPLTEADRDYIAALLIRPTAGGS